MCSQSAISLLLNGVKLAITCNPFVVIQKFGKVVKITNLFLPVCTEIHIKQELTFTTYIQSPDLKQKSRNSSTNIDVVATLW